MKKYRHRLDAMQNEQDLEVTIKSRLNINENAGLNIRVMKCFYCQTSGLSDKQAVRLVEHLNVGGVSQEDRVAQGYHIHVVKFNPKIT